MPCDQEHKVGSSSRWSKVRGILLHDDRYTAVVHSDREELFRKYVEETKVRMKVASNWYVRESTIS